MMDNDLYEFEALCTDLPLPSPVKRTNGTMHRRKGTQRNPSESILKCASHQKPVKEKVLIDFPEMAKIC